MPKNLNENPIFNEAVSDLCKSISGKNTLEVDKILFGSAIERIHRDILNETITIEQARSSSYAVISSHGIYEFQKEILYSEMEKILTYFVEKKKNITLEEALSSNNIPEVERILSNLENNIYYLDSDILKRMLVAVVTSAIEKNKFHHVKLLLNNSNFKLSQELGLKILTLAFKNNNLGFMKYVIENKNISFSKHDLSMIEVYGSTNDGINMYLEELRSIAEAEKSYKIYVSLAKRTRKNSYSAAVFKSILDIELKDNKYVDKVTQALDPLEKINSKDNFSSHIKSPKLRSNSIARL